MFRRLLRHPGLADHELLAFGHHEQQALVAQPLHRPHLGAETAVGRHHQVLGPDPVEALGELAQCLGSAMCDRVEDRAHLVGGRCDVELRPRQHLTHGAHLQAGAPQIGPGHHGRQV